MLRIIALFLSLVVLFACRAPDTADHEVAAIQKPQFANMAAIPAGCFSMGPAFEGGDLTDIPVHTVCLRAFEMDVTEVSNAQYKACVAEGCTAPGANSYTHLRYYGDPTYDKYPVINVNWLQANAYCTWAGKRLPTEAEWEYAARGGIAGKRFPWGDTIDCSKANIYITPSEYDASPVLESKFCVGDTTLGGSYAPNGYGLYDMTGNAAEWVKDWDAGRYYVSRPNPDYYPTGPTTGVSRVFRGGAFDTDAHNAQVSTRAYANPRYQGNTIGIRCAL